ncbi:GNAT family N-acetyltransferase [Lentibacillus saliphilus]
MYNDKTPVGFILFIIDKEEPCYEICRMMIDEQYQKKGYGKKALG